MAERLVSSWLLSLRLPIALTNLIRSLKRLGIAGLIYLHRISDQRMAGTPSKNLTMFRELCGKKIMTNVTLMTTMWGNTLAEDAILREGQLKAKYFKEFLRLGATLARFDDDQCSAVTVLEPLVTAWRARQDEDRILSMVRLQKEVTIYNLEIVETSAARVVHSKVQAILEERREMLAKLADVLEANRDDPQPLQGIVEDAKRLQAELEYAQKEADHLHLHYASHLKMFAAKLQRISHPLLNMVRPSRFMAAFLVR